jgi:rubrerythrin
MRTCVVLIALTALTGCATNFEPNPLPADHPASAQAPEAPRSRTSRLIRTDELSRKTEMQLARKDVPNPDFQDSGMSHDMSKMPGMDHSKMKEMPIPVATATASPADKEALEGEMKKTSDEMKKLSNEMKAKPDGASKSTPAAAVYTCPMHPEVQSDKPGKCPKCGMTLVKKENGSK